MVIPRVIGCLQLLEALQYTQRFRRELTHVLIGAQCKEGTVRGAMFTLLIIIPTATWFAEILKASQQGLAQTFRHALNPK